MTPRPTPLLLGIGVLALEGVASIGWVAVVATVAFALGGAILPILLAVVALGLLFGAACVAAAWGAWVGRSWSWPVAVTVQAVVMLGVVVAALSGGWHPALLAGPALAGLGLVGLLAPSSRRALHV